MVIKNVIVIICSVTYIYILNILFYTFKYFTFNWLLPIFLFLITKQLSVEPHSFYLSMCLKGSY